jgi:heavy metal translocating P-type ATPase
MAVAEATDLVCALCAEPCLEGEAFCCLGCQNVHAILIESGAIREGEDPRNTDLFKRSLELGLVSTGSRSGTQTGVPDNAAEEERLFHVEGMWCGSCAWLIERVLGKEAAIRKADVFFTSDLLRVRFCPQYLPPERIAERLAPLGYNVSSHTAGQKGDSAARRAEVIRLGVSAFLWINVMTLNLSVYLGGGFEHFLPWLVMALATPVVFYCGLPILRAGWMGLRQGVPRMETLLAIGIGAAWTYSITQAIEGGRHIYFDIPCAIVTLVLLGKFVERNAKDSTTRAITGLYQMLPVKARLPREGRERFVAIDALEAGDVFLVKAGERIPADGVVVAGESHVDESILTGESRPVARGAGDAVTGGSLNQSGVLEVRATAVGENSVLAQIVRAVEAALSRRSVIEQTVDKVSRVFVPVVIVLAVLVGLGAWVTGSGVGEGLMRAITVLVIACPCALGIATPLAVTAAVGAASRMGILVSDPRALETVQRADTVVLDKTGTVTEGRFTLLHHEPKHLPFIAAIEVYSEHPLGRAVVEAAPEVLSAGDIEIRKGSGILGDVGAWRVFCGNRRLLSDLGVCLPCGMDERARCAESKGYTVAFYGWNGELAGMLTFGDAIRPDAAPFVRALHERGMKVLLVSGDSVATVQSVAAAVGADDFQAEVLPEAKREFVASLQSRGQKVVMVGDGINDGPAIAQADLGVAMGSGTDLAMKASNVVLMSNRLDRITSVFGLAKRTLQVIRQNLFWAFFYNVVGISFAVMGRLNPILGAGAMVLSSLFVAWNSSRLIR